MDTDTALRIYNAEGERVGFHDDVDYEAGRVDSVLTFSPDAGGVYFISAGAYTGNPTRDNSGRYQAAVYEAETSLTLAGTRGNDFYLHTRLEGSPGDDALDGKGGWDWLEGGPGNDQLRGGPDDDMLDGGEGDDAFVIATGGGNDTILDFGNGADRIDLAAFADIQSVEYLDMRQQETGAVIDLSARGGGTVTLQDFDMADLMDAHFVFFIGEAAEVA